VNAHEHRPDHGATAVEFALVLPLAIMFLAFLTAVGLRVLWAAAADHVTRDAASYAAVPNSRSVYPQGDATVSGMDSVTAHASKIYGGLLGAPLSSIGAVCSSQSRPHDTNEAECPGWADYRACSMAFPSAH
jgi:TadE-like protein